ncbi:hypothetical protein ASC80_15010 [Afipia sp. Root123D2]|nr:hypothetical protein ASC80_15010 [Afipia sp. Root123D2]
MSERPNLKVVVDNKARERKISRPDEPSHNDLLQIILGFAISLPLWGLIGWIIWMWRTGQV